MSNRSNNRDQIDAPNSQLPASGSPKLWGPIGATLWAIVIYVIPQVIVGALLFAYGNSKQWSSSQTNDWLTGSIPAQFVYTFFVEAMALGIVWLVLKYYKAAVRTIGLLRPMLKDILYALVGFAVYFVMYLVLLAIVKQLVPSLNVNQQQDVGFQNATTTATLVMAFVSLVILPPFAEEIIFRGFVFTGFRRKFGFVIATLGTSILFAAPHLLEGDGGGLLWVAGIDTLILSFVLCFLREKTGRLWAGMGVHGLKNGLAFASLFIFHVH